MVVTNPWKCEKDYRREVAEWRGVVLAGYGGGNGNLDVPAGRSVVPAVKAALREGKPVVLSSQVALGDTDFVYRNGHELVAAGAVSAAALTLPHVQIKLAYLLGHRDDIEHAAETTRVSFRDLLDRCMTAGAGFRNAESLPRYSGLRGYSPLPDDPFVDVPFEEGLGHVVRKTIAPVKRTGRRLADPIARLADILKANGLADPGTRRHWAAILKPDAVVGGTVSGEPIDAAASLATLVESLLGLTPLVVDLHDLGLDGLREAVTRIAGRQQSWAAFLRTFGLLSVEGGRQSVYDEGSFQGPLTRTGYLDLFENLILGRTLPAVRPGLFICLRHQGYSASLARLAGRVLDESRDDLSRAARAVPGRSPKALEAFLERAARMATTWRVRGDAGDALAEGIAHTRAAVHPNEKGKELVVELRPYGTGSAPHKVPAEVRKAHEEVAARHLTSVEEVIAGPAGRLSMLHGDEVDEAVLLFLNWFYSGLASHLGPAVRPGVATGHAVLDDLAVRLPVGVEITSCTLYRDVLRTEAARAGRRPAASTPASGHSLTEVGSTAVYYRDAAGTGVVHDVTAQFHPELIGVDRVYGPADLRSLPLGQLSDGERMLARMGVGA